MVFRKLPTGCALAAFVGASTVVLATPSHALGFVTTLLPDDPYDVSGKASLVINTTTNQMVMMAAVKNLTGTTTGSHIHGPTPTPFAGTAGTITPHNIAGFPLGVSNFTYQQTFDLLAASTYSNSFVTANGGVAGARDAFLAALKDNKAYLKIHSSIHDGELRGFFQQQAPGPLPLLGAGAAFGWSRRLRNRLAKRADNRLTTAA
jgi:MYXO-CTERM domain-containing protein